MPEIHKPIPVLETHIESLPSKIKQLMVELNGISRQMQKSLSDWGHLESRIASTEEEKAKKLNEIDDLLKNSILFNESHIQTVLDNTFDIDDLFELSNIAAILKAVYSATNLMDKDIQAKLLNLEKNIDCRMEYVQQILPIEEELNEFLDQQDKPSISAEWIQNLSSLIKKANDVFANGKNPEKNISALAESLIDRLIPLLRDAQKELSFKSQIIELVSSIKLATKYSDSNSIIRLKTEVEVFENELRD